MVSKLIFERIQRHIDEDIKNICDRSKVYKTQEHVGAIHLALEREKKSFKTRRKDGNVTEVINEFKVQPITVKKGRKQVNVRERLEQQIPLRNRLQ